MIVHTKSVDFNLTAWGFGKIFMDADADAQAKMLDALTVHAQLMRGPWAFQCGAISDQLSNQNKRTEVLWMLETLVEHLKG